MSKLKYKIASMRLRTLPLSLAGVLLGSLLAIAEFRVQWQVVVLICLTTVCLQILSNLSNELGDALHGTDTEERPGPTYGMGPAAGSKADKDGKEEFLTVAEMKRLIIGAAIAACAFGAAMIRVSFGTFLCIESICLLLLGAAAIAAAIRYTLGRNPYGYRGLGDIYVFLFFGLVSVLGSYFVCAHTLLGWKLLLPASTIGFFSVAVLNVNNIRDMASDAATRRTVALMLGVHKARIYQTILICLGWACMTAFCLLRIPDWRHFLFFLTLPLYCRHLFLVWTREGRALDAALPLLVLSTFAFSLLTGFGFCAFLY